MNWFVSLILQLAQVPQKDIDDLNNSIPAGARLLAASQQLDPLLQQAKPHLEALIPLARQAYEILKPRAKDAEALAPLVQDFIAFLKARKQGQ